MGWEGASMSTPGGGGGEGAAKAWYGQLISLENHFTDNVSALSLSCQILQMFQADWPVTGFFSPMCSAARPFQVGVRWGIWP